MDNKLNNRGETKRLTLFLSKALTAWTCPKKYDFLYNLWRVPKEESPALRRGRLVHKAIAEALKGFNKTKDSQQARLLGLGSLYSEISTLPDEEFTPILEHTRAVEDKVLGRHIVAIEKVISFFTPNWIWKGRVDHIEEDDDGGLWLGEVKTTSSYSSTLQRLYHKGVQPWTYVWLLTKMFPNTPIKGIRMYISSKKVKPRFSLDRNPSQDPNLGYNCVVEEIPSYPQALQAAEKFIFDSVKFVMNLDLNLQNRSMCQTFFGECPYVLLCAPKVEPKSSYFEELLEQFFIKRDPEDHLKE